MKTFALLFAIACASLTMLDNSAEAATPRFLSSAPVGLSNPVTKIGLNPQPLPPRYLTFSKRFNPGGKVSLNPQPLPPRLLKKF